MQPTDFFFDVDSTVITRESLLDVVLEAAGRDTDGTLERKLLEITNAGMNGEFSFEESLKRRLAFAVIRRSHMETVMERMLDEITDGMESFMHDLRGGGHGVWLLSAGVREMMLPLAGKLGISEMQVLANDAVWTDGRLTGFAAGPLLKTEGKASVLKHLKAQGSLSGRVIMIGDGAGDLHTYEAGEADDFFGFGEHAVRPSVLEKAPRFFRSVAEMREFVGL